MGQVTDGFNGVVVVVGGTRIFLRLANFSRSIAVTFNILISYPQAVLVGSFAPLWIFIALSFSSTVMNALDCLIVIPKFSDIL